MQTHSLCHCDRFVQLHHETHDDDDTTCTIKCDTDRIQCDSRVSLRIISEQIDFLITFSFQLSACPIHMTHDMSDVSLPVDGSIGPCH